LKSCLLNRTHSIVDIFITLKRKIKNSDTTTTVIISIRTKKKKERNRSTRLCRAAAAAIQSSPETVQNALVYAAEEQIIMINILFSMPIETII